MASIDHFNATNYRKLERDDSLLFDKVVKHKGCED